MACRLEILAKYCRYWLLGKISKGLLTINEQEGNANSLDRE